MLYFTACYTLLCVILYCILYLNVKRRLSLPWHKSGPVVLCFRQGYPHPGTNGHILLDNHTLLIYFTIRKVILILVLLVMLYTYIICFKHGYSYPGINSPVVLILARSRHLGSLPARLLVASLLRHSNHRNRVHQ